MKRILYSILAALVATAATAQIYRGEGGSFPIRYNTGSYDNFGYMRLHEPLATVCCYLDKDGNVAKQTLAIYLSSLGKEIDVKDDGEIAFCFSDGNNKIVNYKTISRKSEMWQTGLCYTAVIEAAVELELFKNNILRKTLIDGNNAVWGITTPTKRAKKIKKAIVVSEQLAKSNALEAKANNQVYIEPFKLPTHVETYLLDFYPKGTVFVAEKIDTIELPARTLASLDFSIKLDMMKFAERFKIISSFKGVDLTNAVKKEVSIADSLFCVYDACLARIDSVVARNAKCEKDNYENYQRVSVAYTLPDKSKGATDVLTRIGEQKPSDIAMDFDLTLSTVKEEYAKFKKNIDAIRIAP